MRIGSSSPNTTFCRDEQFNSRQITRMQSKNTMIKKVGTLNTGALARTRTGSLLRWQSDGERVEKGYTPWIEGRGGGIAGRGTERYSNGMPIRYCSCSRCRQKAFFSPTIEYAIPFPFRRSSSSPFVDQESPEARPGVTRRFVLSLAFFFLLLFSVRFSSFSPFEDYHELGDTAIISFTADLRRLVTDSPRSLFDPGVPSGFISNRPMGFSFRETNSERRTSSNRRAETKQRI